MSGAWMAGMVAVALAAAPDEAPILEDEPADEVAATGATVDPAAPRLPSAPTGPALADGGPILLERVERPDGTALERLLEPSGAIVLHEVNRVGTVLSCRTVGKLLSMRVVEQREAAAGEVVHVVRDGSGALLRFVVGADGEPRAVVVLAPAPSSVAIQAGSGGR